METGRKLGTHSAPTPCLGQSRIRQKVATFTGASLALGGVGLHWSYVQSQRSALLSQLRLFVFGECNLIRPYSVIEPPVLPWVGTTDTGSPNDQPRQDFPPPPHVQDAHRPEHGGLQADSSVSSSTEWSAPSSVPKIPNGKDNSTAASRSATALRTTSSSRGAPGRSRGSAPPARARNTTKNSLTSRLCASPKAQSSGPRRLTRLLAIRSIDLTLKGITTLNLSRSPGQFQRRN